MISDNSPIIIPRIETVTAVADLVGNYDGAVELRTFDVNESFPMGGTINIDTHYNRISIMEQNNSFVRGVEYRSENGISDWIVYSNFFGIISRKSNQLNIYTLKLQQFLNSDSGSSSSESSSILLGERVGYLNSSDTTMHIEYTGQSVSLLEFGGESYVATKTR